MTKIGGGNQQYYNQGMPVGNMNVNLNGNVDTGFLSKIALILAVLSFICCCIDWLFSIPAVICAVIALIKNKKDACAWAAMALAGVSLVMYLLLAITGLMGDITDSVKNGDYKKEATKVQDSGSQGSDNSVPQTENSKVSDEGKESTNSQISYEITDTQFYTFTNSIGSLEYFFIMEVENTGDLPIYLDSCKVDIEDNDERLLLKGDTVSSCPKVVKPGEKGYFYNGALDSILVNSTAGDDALDTSNGVNAAPVYTIEKANYEPIQYDVSDLSISSDSWSTKVTGRVINNTDEEASRIDIHAIFYGESGKVLAINGTSVYGLGAGQKDSFEISTMFGAGELNFEDIADYKVIATEYYYQW